MNQKTFKVTPIRIGLGSIFIVVVLILWNPVFLDNIELQSLDLRFLARGKILPGPEVVIAAIDEKSQDVLGRWPWTRSNLAVLVKKLNTAGARTIGFDIIFSERETDDRKKLIRLMDRQIKTKLLDEKTIVHLKQEILNEKTPDEEFAEAITNSGNVILGYFFHDSMDDVKHLPAGLIQEGLTRIQSTRYIHPENEFEGELVFLRQYPAVEPNLPMFSQGAVQEGFLNVIPDQDGIVRHYPLIAQANNNYFPPFFIKVVSHYLRQRKLFLVINEFGKAYVKMDLLEIPTDTKGNFLINYYGDQKTFPHYSIADIIQDKINLKVFEDRIVLIGATGKALADFHATPFERVLSGVEINATIIDNILQDRFLRQPDWYFTLNYLLVFAIGLVLAVVLTRLNAVNGFLISALFLVSFHALNQWIFNMGVWINLIYPSIQILFTYTGITVYRFAFEERQKRFIKGAFAKYIAPEFVNKLIDNPELLKPGGEERVMTVLFSDLVGFTAISEKMTPVELAKFINEYFTEMTAVVLEEEGTVVQYAGDAMMVSYGAPNPLPDHAHRAVRSAVKMQRRLRQLNQIWGDRGLSELGCRIGINTGKMLFGNLGSRQVYYYSAMGDNVNLAARLETANKQYHTQIMISEGTFDNLQPEKFRARVLDVIKVEGKTKAVKVYEVYGEITDELAPETLNYYRTYHEAFTAYLDKEFSLAHEKFTQALALRSNDPAAQGMLSRIQSLDLHSLPEEWDGSITLTSK